MYRIIAILFIGLGTIVLGAMSAAGIMADEHLFSLVSGAGALMGLFMFIDVVTEV